MIIRNREIAFLSFYVLDKEYHLHDNVREALDMIAKLIYIDKLHENLAIDAARKQMIKKYNNELDKKFLLKLFKRRKAYIKNGKDAFKKFDLDKRIIKLKVKEYNHCECGCGLTVKSGNRFINGHNVKMKSQDEKNRHSEHMRKFKNNKKFSNVYYMKNFSISG